MENATSVNAEEVLDTKQWVNFRFTVDQPQHEDELAKSMYRTADELSSLFGENCSLSFDTSSALDLSVFPFTKSEESHVILNQGFDFPVFSDGKVICADDTLDANLKPLPNDDFISLAYREQFVFRVLVFVDTERTNMESFNHALGNIIDNACIDGVRLLSIEVSSQFIDGVSLMMRESRSVAQPVTGMPKRAPKCHSLHELLGGKSMISLSEAVQGIMHDLVGYEARIIDHNGDDASTFNLNGQPVSFLTIVTNQLGKDSFDGNADAGMLSTHVDNRLLPIWLKYGIVTNGERKTVLARIVNVPEFQTVEEGFSLARSYPVSHFFNDFEGSEYFKVLDMMEGGKFSALLDSGIALQRKISSQGRVIYMVRINYIQQGTYFNESLFEGGEPEICEFIHELLEALPQVGQFTATDVISKAEDISFTKVSA